VSLRAARGAAALLLVLAACPAPAPRRTLRPPARPSVVEAEPAPAKREAAPAPDARAVHVVRRGETLWRIARTYGVEPAELMARNGISDPRAVAVGTELVVPGASRALQVPPAGAEPAPAATAPNSTATSTSTSTSRAARARLAWPLKGVLYGRYGLRSGQRHDGIDIAAPEGTTVGAAADGTVIFAGRQAGYGALVILRHGGGLVTLYAHNARVLVKQGQEVRQGQPIATVGQTGKTTGPHLHFEVREGTRPRDPLRFLP
jgi:murein DD-endopeptidase MepM/ murein hydrolase activator NlpD